jgi:hypothetical protein
LPYGCDLVEIPDQKPMESLTTNRPLRQRAVARYPRAKILLRVG